ncbi:MAG: hypothetical protein EBX52_10240, partial [Proteobacteria bacterium]|nr:hypothetical protein [Pseudomonadota bacterium]
IITINDKHVSAVASTPLKITSSRSILDPRERRNDLKKCSSQGEKRVMETILPNAGIRIANLDTQHVLYQT